MISEILYQSRLLEYNLLYHPRWAFTSLRSKLFRTENSLHKKRIEKYLSGYPLLGASSTHNRTNARPAAHQDCACIGAASFEKKTKRNAGSAFPAFLGADLAFVNACYCSCRRLRPKTVIETGVGRGTNSMYILSALQENNYGELYSIDMPAFRIHIERSVGELVPPSLKNRWHLFLDDSIHALPAILDEVKTVDIFIHDSDHSYRHMLMEFNIIWDSLKKPGLLIADNVDTNDAFLEFASTVDRTPKFVKNIKKNEHFGVIEK